MIYGRYHNRTEVEEYEGTFIYRTLLFYNSVFLRRYETVFTSTYSYFFRRSIIVVCSIIVFSSIFLTFTYIYQFCSIISFRGLLINFAESPFYNSGFYVTFFRGPRKIHKMMQIYVRLCK